MIRHALVLLSLLSGAAWAQEAPPTRELELLSEHPVEGMAAGNLSGLAWCGDALWAVSDREDDRLYRLDASDSVWRGEAEHFDVPPAPNTGLPWGVRVRSAITGLVRGGEMDFEGLSCDSLGNRYLASEAHAAVLRVSPAGMAEWLPLPEALVRQARASGMLLDFNAMFEGIAVDPEANRLWLAAERERRGLLVMHRNQSSWQCTGGCVLLAEGGRELPPPALGDQPLPRRFSGLAYFNDKLFTLEPSAHQVCRRSLASGQVERCWSYAATALADERRYDTPFGNAEALSLDEQGAWIGVDNNAQARRDGEKRPIVWRFAAPKGGWGARQ
ncbi:esterase-like activity of phytase family protein [Stutzerimonas nitrititolerans]|uniref:esterase-like activity of phytase family protein n=1 Tax=Stutzerimonas nitrititolerans TaxID=2482751 RepID=UPI0028A29B9B|nr:esterase-like activity of phytase family protein [Stutzerimonas nitrititolerans]